MFLGAGAREGPESWVRKVAGRARHSTQRALTDPAGYCALSTPRISLAVPKTVICACSQGPSDVGSAINGAVQGWVPGVGYTGWVYRVGTGRGIPVLPGPNPCLNQRFCAHPRHSRPLQGPPHTWGSPHSNTRPGAKYGEIPSYIY